MQATRKLFTQTLIKYNKHMEMKTKLRIILNNLKSLKAITKCFNKTFSASENRVSLTKKNSRKLYANEACR